MSEICSVTHLFAYGSLTEGMVHFQKIQQFVRNSEPGFVKGSAFRLRVGFPVVLESGSDLIPGQLLTVESTPFLIELLDRFHGVNTPDTAKGLFYRKEVSVFDQNPETPEKRGWIYFLNPDRLTSDALEIQGGDWRCTKPKLTETLTERQKQYILRLGA